MKAEASHLAASWNASRGAIGLRLRQTSTKKTRRSRGQSLRNGTGLPDRASVTGLSCAMERNGASLIIGATVYRQHAATRKAEAFISTGAACRFPVRWILQSRPMKSRQPENLRTAAHGSFIMGRPERTVAFTLRFRVASSVNARA